MSLESLKDLDVANISMLCFLEFLYENVDNVLEGISVDKFKEVLSKYEATINVLPEVYITEVRKQTKKSLQEFFSGSPGVEERMKEMDAIVDARPKRKMCSVLKQYPPMDSDTLMALVDKKLNERLAVKVEQLNEEGEMLKDKVQEKSDSMKSDIKTVKQTTTVLEDLHQNKN